MIEFISQPWPWYVAGPLIALTMFLLLFFGKNFGVSSTLRTACAIGGAGKLSDFFDYDWKSQVWNLVFVGGMVIGGFIASTWLQQPDPIPLAQGTVEKLQELGISNPGEQYLPAEIFSWESLFTLRGFILLVVGGFFIGFGTRWAGGCTSGHAISGLSNLQLPSLIAVVGFFIGGLLMTHLLLPLILQL
ncbi:YeeE/YedE family protein [Cesiribacter sp. SM1]|uniref:YeeE/YedE family protein n=1 Tax=Cesiribacter sp. SM1 TaxID=2861196 RepID=UPI001CD70088|nr:YeeE/YedE thiosulfate transporter family protein [Cesiribacter sp. SM1]